MTSKARTKLRMLDGTTRIVDRAAISYGVYDVSIFPRGRMLIPASEMPVYGWVWLNASKPVIVMHVGLDADTARAVDPRALSPLMKREMKGFMMERARGTEMEAVNELFRDFKFKTRSCSG